MLPNHIVIGISDNGQRVVVQPVHPFLSDMVQEIPLADLEQRGYDGAVRMLGVGILETLRVIHADTLTRYPGLLPPPADSPSVENIELAEKLSLIATNEPSPAYVQVIDSLMRVEAGKRRSNHPFMATWPKRRDLLLRLGSGTGAA